MGSIRKHKGVFPPRFEHAMYDRFRPYTYKEVLQQAEQLGLKPDHARKILAAIDAAVHIYGIVSLEEMQGLLDAYHLDMDLDTLAKLAQICNHHRQNAYFFVDRLHIDSGQHSASTREWSFVSKYLVRYPQWYKTVREDMADKAMVRLPKKEFFRYADPHYFASTPESEKLMAMMMARPGFDEQKSRGILAQTNAFIQAGGPWPQVVDQFAIWMHMPDHETRQALTDAVIAYYNDTRMWANRGDTPLAMLQAEKHSEHLDLDIHQNHHDHKGYQKGVRDTLEKQISCQQVHPAHQQEMLRQMDAADQAGAWKASRS